MRERENRGKGIKCVFMGIMGLKGLWFFINEGGNAHERHTRLINQHQINVALEIIHVDQSIDAAQSQSKKSDLVIISLVIAQLKYIN